MLLVLRIYREQFPSWYFKIIFFLTCKILLQTKGTNNGNAKFGDRFTSIFYCKDNATLKDRQIFDRNLTIYDDTLQYITVPHHLIFSLFPSLTFWFAHCLTLFMLTSRTLNTFKENTSFSDAITIRIKCWIQLLLLYSSKLFRYFSMKNELYGIQYSINNENRPVTNKVAYL